MPENPRGPDKLSGCQRSERTTAVRYGSNRQRHRSFRPVKALFDSDTGNPGHGIMHSPAAAEALSKLILGKEHDLDVSPLAPSRFAEGKLLHETAVI